MTPVDISLKWVIDIDSAVVKGRSKLLLLFHILLIQKKV